MQRSCRNQKKGMRHWTSGQRNRSKSPTRSTDSSEDVVHKGITCDGCDKDPIKGIRFKCSTCADYDLCEKCMSKGYHSEYDDHHFRIIRNAS